MAEDKEPFIARWSRRKLQAAEQSPAKPAAGEAPAPAVVQAPPAAGMAPPATGAAPSEDSSAYSQYFDPKTDAALRKAALRKLFSDPHFNVMDGLDTYIDDYSIPDPLSPELMRQLNQAKELFLSEEERQGEVGVTDASTGERLASAREVGDESEPKSIGADPN